jgi:hypothetical protein
MDQNGVVYDPKIGHKRCKNGAFRAVFCIFTVRFRSVSNRIIEHRNTYFIVTVNCLKYAMNY